MRYFNVKTRGYALAFLRISLARIDLTPSAPEAGVLSAELQGHLRRSVPQALGSRNKRGICLQRVFVLYFNNEDPI
jgi:hypothetical protein